MACIYGSGNGRSKQNPARPTGGSLAAARHTFRIWRRTRPFWGGLVVIVGAGEMLVSEQAPLRIVTHIGIQGLAGYLIPTFMLLCGALLWLNPVDRIIYSLLALFLALGSWITSNLGGFFIGMVVGVVGGALAFAWTTEAEYGPPALPHGKERIALPPSPPGGGGSARSGTDPSVPDAAPEGPGAAVPDGWGHSRLDPHYR